MSCAIEAAALIEVVQRHTFNVLIPRHIFIHRFIHGLDCVHIDNNKCLHYKKELVQYRLLKEYLEQHQQAFCRDFEDLDWCLNAVLTKVKLVGKE